MGRAIFSHKRALTSVSEYGTCHSPEVEQEVPQQWKKVFIWYKVIIEISKEVETSFPEVEKGILLVYGYFQR